MIIVMNNLIKGVVIWGKMQKNMKQVLPVTAVYPKKMKTLAAVIL